MTELTLVAPAPHGGRPVFLGGAPVAEAKGALLLLHGRGADAAGMLELAGVVAPRGYAFFAPEAARNTWYPFPFIEPMDRNEPALSSALAAVRALIETIGAAGIPPERVALVGFSQGACLALESAVRRARRYGAVIGLSGGLIGPPGTPREYPGTFGGTPVFLGCSDVDPHIPLERVHETAEVLRRMGAQVDEQIYAGMPHTINRDEVQRVQAILDAIVQ